MTRKGSIHILDPRLKQAVDDAITEGRATIDEIVQLVRGMGGDVSRSAVGRYKKSMEERLADFREAQAIAAEWKAQLLYNPDGDLMRMLIEMLKVIAHKKQSALIGEDGVEAKDLSHIARTIRDLASVEDRMLAIAQKARAAAAEKAAEAVDRVGKAMKLDPEALRKIREEVYGIVPAGGGA